MIGFWHQTCMKAGMAQLNMNISEARTINSMTELFTGAGRAVRGDGGEYEWRETIRGRNFVYRCNRMPDAESVCIMQKILNFAFERTRDNKIRLTRQDLRDLDISEEAIQRIQRILIDWTEVRWTTVNGEGLKTWSVVTALFVAENAEYVEIMFSRPWTEAMNRLADELALEDLKADRDRTD